MSTDQTFITNEGNANLLQRFTELISNTQLFDVLVGYFYTSGFFALYKSLEKSEKIRILVGINTNQQVVDLIENSKQMDLEFSTAETKEHFENAVENEFADSEDSKNVEEGVQKFIDWLRNGKLEIRAYPNRNIHAKIYIMTFPEGHYDRGRVITGSSNFTKSGLVENLEFNVELKNSSDYEFAKAKFEELWKSSVDLKDKYIETVNYKTWLNDTITPYQLYLKFLYEYFKDELNKSEETTYRYLPTDFIKLDYQDQAVLNAKKILDEYGGVFISDVVGLGKTYMSAMLANHLDGRNLVIAPPVLLDESNPGSWNNVFKHFNVAATFRSIGVLDSILKENLNQYKNVFIDEAHRFRTESNITYEKLAQICRGKRVILVTATPYNNSPRDVLSQIKLFQKTKKSTIPNLPNLESFFSKLEKKIKKLDRRKDRNKYMTVSKENAKEVRDKVLKYLMVRRTRTEIENFFSQDLKQQGLKFPEVVDPEPIFYQFNDLEESVFNKTIELVTQKFKYSRYTPMLYYEGKLSQPEELAQKNMSKFMKILLVKRLESSFYAFRNSINRFISSYENFIQEFNNGFVYLSKKHTNKIFELLENDDDDAIQKLIDEEKAEKYPSDDFRDSFKKDLTRDLDILNEIRSLWNEVERDPKLLTLIDLLSSSEILKNKKLILFTESKETAEYLYNSLQKNFSDKVLLFTGSCTSHVRDKVIENFDAKSQYPKNDYLILIATEVLSEGVNLHASNIVINYDIPWNPTRLMQRVGRINRVDTEFDKIYSFNFFPTTQSNEQIKLKEAAEAKIQSFISLLGADARLLTEGEEIESHELFDKLISKKTITGEDDYQESRLKYLEVIKNIRDNDPDLFSQIKKLPKKSRTSKKNGSKENQLLTYFRKGKIQKFFAAGKGVSKELDFISAAKTLEVNKSVKRQKIPENFYDLLDKNKSAFSDATTYDLFETKLKGGRDSATQVVKILKAIKDFRQFTEEQESYWFRVIKQLEEGGLPKQTSKKLSQELNNELKNGIDPIKLLAVLQKNIPDELLEEHIVEKKTDKFTKNEVILSEYLIGS